jgi:signal transduction histidine kinase
MPDSGDSLSGAPVETERHDRAALADAIARRRDEIEQRWLERVQHECLTTNQEVPRSELRDSIGEYLVRLARALTGGESISTSGRAAWADVAREHAQNRVRIGFDIDQLVAEFILLRRVLSDVAQEEGLLPDSAQSERLADLIDAAISTSVKSYVESRDLAGRRVQVQHIGFLTHELRNPLTTATMAATRLRRRQHIVDADSDTLDILERGLNRVRSLIDGILATQRFDAGEVEAHPQDRTLAEIIPDATRAAELEARNKGIVFTTRYEPAVELRVDPTLTISALQNVIDNAVKFTDRGDVRLVVDSAESEVIIHVYDNCDGFTSEELKTIFEPFKRAHSGKAGTGLGLAIARRAVETQGGRIGAESTVGQGCHFWLAFPKPKH